jgi:heavy metal translocating P-type ATPase
MPEASDHAARAGLPHALLALAATLLGAGLGARLLGQPEVADWCWIGATVAGLAPATYWVVERALARQLGADVVAVLALAGTLAIGEYLAGAVISLMLASGRVLEDRASRRARRELRALRSRVPVTTHLVTDDGLTDVRVDDVRPGDLVAVLAGEVVPVDGRVEERPAVLDESALTGESLPVERSVGDDVRSGALNASHTMLLRATRRAEESTYAGVVRLAEQAEADASSARTIRLADRYAGVFLLCSLLAAAAAWMVSGEAARAVAVLVVATPCPLILAVPVAITSGLSQAASRGVLVKGGLVLEQLADARVLLLDKTGTVTAGRPAVTDVISIGGIDETELLRLAASLDQTSPHVLARAVVAAARDRRLQLSMPAGAAEEVAGAGIRGVVDGHVVALGKATWVAPGRDQSWSRAIRRTADLDGRLTVFVSVDGEPAGALLLADPVRPDGSRMIAAMRAEGIDRVIMVTGDRADVARGVGVLLGVDDVLAERSPADKVAAVAAARAGGPTIMVGDGINDAAALATADVGIAVGAAGGTAASEAADAVLVSDRLDRVGEVMGIARHARRVARQSAGAGIGLSVIAMGLAIGGWLPPTAGALLQELIDVAVILNAIRARRAPGVRRRVQPEDVALAQRFSAQHALLLPKLARLRAAADRLGSAPGPAALAEVRAVVRFLTDELLPHEQAEDAQLYPVVDRVLGGHAPTATMSRAHAEITHQIALLERALVDVGPEDLDSAEIRRLQGLLYGLHAILELHFAQEDEGYLGLLEAGGVDSTLPAAR